MATSAKKVENMSEAFESISIATPEFFKDSYEKASKNMGDFVDFHKASVEAMMSSAGVFAKAVEQAATEHAAFIKESVEDSVSAAQACASSKSIQDAMTVQNDYMRTAVEKNLNQINKVADQWMSVSKEVSEPITEQYGAFVEKVQAFRP